jgi:hypothetical protein
MSTMNPCDHHVLDSDRCRCDSHITINPDCNVESERIFVHPGPALLEPGFPSDCVLSSLGGRGYPILRGRTRGGAS